MVFPQLESSSVYSARVGSRSRWVDRPVQELHQLALLKLWVASDPSGSCELLQLREPQSINLLRPRGFLCGPFVGQRGGGGGGDASPGWRWSRDGWPPEKIWRRPRRLEVVGWWRVLRSHVVFQSRFLFGWLLIPWMASSSSCGDAQVGWGIKVNAQGYPETGKMVHQVSPHPWKELWEKPNLLIREKVNSEEPETQRSSTERFGRWWIPKTIKAVPFLDSMNFVGSTFPKWANGWKIIGENKNKESTFKTINSNNYSICCLIRITCRKHVYDEHLFNYRFDMFNVCFNWTKIGHSDAIYTWIITDRKRKTLVW